MKTKKIAVRRKVGPTTKWTASIAKETPTRRPRDVRATKAAWAQLEDRRNGPFVEQLELPLKTEGQVLRAELTKILQNLRRDLHNMEGTVEKMRPFMGNNAGDGPYPHVLLQFNRALNRISEWSNGLDIVLKKLKWRSVATVKHTTKWSHGTFQMRYTPHEDTFVRGNDFVAREHARQCCAE